MPKLHDQSWPRGSSSKAPPGNLPSCLGSTSVLGRTRRFKEAGQVGLPCDANRSSLMAVQVTSVHQRTRGSSCQTHPHHHIHSTAIIIEKCRAASSQSHRYAFLAVILSIRISCHCHAFAEGIAYFHRRLLPEVILRYNMSYVDAGMAAVMPGGQLVLVGFRTTLL